jgi:hypothetical protein
VTVSAGSNKVTWLGNGAASTFSYNFCMPAASDAVVLFTDATGNQTTIPPSAYTLTGIGQPTAGGGPQGGMLSYAPGGLPIAAGTSLTLLRETPNTQPNTFVNQSGLWAQVVEQSDDRLELQIQQIAETVSRAVVEPVGDGASMALPNIARRASTIIGFDGEGNVAVYPLATLPAALQVALQGWTSVKAFGATGNGVTDDTAALQDAIDSTPGGALYLPPGTYVTSAPLLISTQISIGGCGRQTCTIAPNGSFVAINIDTPSSVILRDFGIFFAPGVLPAAIGIALMGNNVGARFVNLYVWGADTGISISFASYFVIDGCLIQSSIATAIHLEDLLYPDAGDSTICNTTLLNTVPIVAPTHGITYYSAGGLRVENCKINGFAYGIQLTYTGSVAASDFQVVGCSFEGNAMLVGIYIARTSTGSWLNVLIANNQFEVEGIAPIGVQVIDSAARWLTMLSITGNIFHLGALGVACGIQLGGTQGFLIANNIVLSQNGATRIVQTTAQSDLGVVGPNLGIGPFTASLIESTNTTQIAPT